MRRRDEPISIVGIVEVRYRRFADHRLLCAHKPKTCRKRIYFTHLFVVENYVERMTVDYRSRNDDAFYE